MRCEIYGVTADNEKTLVDECEFLTAPLVGDQVQLDDQIFVVVGRRLHNVGGEMHGAVEVFVKVAQ